MNGAINSRGAKFSNWLPNGMEFFEVKDRHLKHFIKRSKAFQGLVHVGNIGSIVNLSCENSLRAARTKTELTIEFISPAKGLCPRSVGSVTWVVSEHLERVEVSNSSK